MDFVIVSMAAAFVVSAVDNWIDLRALRGIVAAGAAALLVYRQEPDVTDVVQISLGAGFVALAVIEVMSTLANKTLVIKARR